MKKIKSLKLNYILLILVGFSCTKSKDNIEYISFEKTYEPIELTGEEVQLTGEILGLIYIHKQDSLIVGSTLQDDNLYWVFRKNHIKGSFGNVGNGPGEINAPTHVYDGSEGAIYIYEPHLLLLHEVDLLASLNEKKLITTYQYELPKELSGTKNIYPINRSLIVGVYDDNFNQRLDKKRGLFYYNVQENNYELIPLFNSEIEPYEVMPATNINAKIPTIAPDRSKLAIANIYNPLIEIVDLKNKLIKRVVVEAKEIKKHFTLEEYKNEELVTYFKFAYSTDSRLYFLYAGISENESEDYPQYLQIMNWSGEPLGYYEIPKEYNLTSFFVENSKTLVGHSYINDALYTFDLEK